MGILNWILEKDLFGYKVELSFNDQGSEHKTYVGGLVSLMVKSFMLIFTTSLFIKLFTYGDDSISTIIS